MGKIITYASGFDAEIVIWIVQNVRDEHKQAIDWLNEHTDQKVNIFAIQMEVWQIAESSYAPKLQVIAKPNDWAKAIKRAATEGELSADEYDIVGVYVGDELRGVAEITYLPALVFIY